MRFYRCWAFTVVLSSVLPALLLCQSPSYTGCNGQQTSGLLTLNITALNNSTGFVQVNGVDSRRPTSSFTWNWGDGTTTPAFFPQSHTYANVQQNYTLQVVARERWLLRLRADTHTVFSSAHDRHRWRGQRCELCAIRFARGYHFDLRDELRFVGWCSDQTTSPDPPHGRFCQCVRFTRDSLVLRLFRPDQGAGSLRMSNDWDHSTDRHCRWPDQHGSDNLTQHRFSWHFHVRVCRCNSAF
jgi:hypothetical protein